MFDDNCDYGFEDYKQNQEDGIREARENYKKELSTINQKLLFLKYEAEARHSEILNTIVDNNKFRAFDIAINVKESGAPLTVRQREALENILAYYYARY